MAPSVSPSLSSNPVRLPDNSGRPAKAALRPTYRQTMTDAILRYYGSVKNAAYVLGACDPSLMMREFHAGKFARFDEHAEDGAMSYVAAALHDVFGKQTDLHQRTLDELARIQKIKLIRDLRQRLNSQLDSLLESL